MDLPMVQAPSQSAIVLSNVAAASSPLPPPTPPTPPTPPPSAAHPETQARIARAGVRNIRETPTLSSVVVGASARTVYEASRYIQLVPAHISYEDPEAYRETVQEYYDGLLDRAGDLVGGYDPESTPRYGEIYGYSFTPGLDLAIPYLDPLNLPPIPPAPEVPGSTPPGQCLPGGRRIAFVEILYEAATANSIDYGADDVRNYSGNARILIRCWFPGAISLFSFDPQNDVYPLGGDFFSIPDECSDLGISGGYARIVTEQADNPPVGTTFSITHSLQLNYEGECWEVYRWGEFGYVHPGGIGISQQGGLLLSGSITTNLSYRIRWNPPWDEIAPPPPLINPPPPFIDMADCCSCRNIAGMLAVQFIANSGVTAAAAFLLFDALAVVETTTTAATLTAVGAIEAGSVALELAAAPVAVSLFERAFGLATTSGAMGAVVAVIRRLLEGVARGDATDLSPILQRLDRAFVNVGGGLSLNCEGDDIENFSGLSMPGTFEQISLIARKLERMHDLLCAAMVRVGGGVAIDCDGEDIETFSGLSMPGTFEQIGLLTQKLDRIHKLLCEAIVSVGGGVNTECLDSEDNELITFSGLSMPGVFKQLAALTQKLDSIQKFQCEKPPVAAIPEWWQTRIGAERPQVVFQFGKQLENGKIGAPHYAISVPHPLSSSFDVCPIGAYTKGSFQGMAILDDNSKIIVNCASENECERVMAECLSIVRPELKTNVQERIVRRKGKALLAVRVVPRICRFFPDGQMDIVPSYEKYYD